ncbi:16S rRNA (cytidine(1402)-2'-O)-methyltransferase [Synechococcus sp. M16CYN]|uniref:16S rRNA (cytidine(1402)-2'-O)-methyltransferase n=1 Tax=Synechococcus sp. M16CYN TaxID=3103139 RepID=UPI00333EC95C
MQRDEPAAGSLYLVGTPIGHMGDLSPRAIHLLTAVDVIVCEDTRHSGQLLGRLGAKGRRLSFHRYNARARLPQLLELLAGGSSLAVVSDAGLPAVSDPGEELVAAARRAGHAVLCVPGPCAATTALVSSGLPSGRFCFEGFLPTKNKERRQRLEQIASELRTTVLYEAPHRLITLLSELCIYCGSERPLQVARELTKCHEEQVGPTVQAALNHFQQTHPQGEFTLVLGGAPITTAITLSDIQLTESLRNLIAQGTTASDAARQLARETGLSRRRLYALLHQETSD